MNNRNWYAENLKTGECRPFEDLRSVGAFVNEMNNLECNWIITNEDEFISVAHKS